MSCFFVYISIEIRLLDKYLALNLIKDRVIKFLTGQINFIYFVGMGNQCCDKHNKNAEFDQANTKVFDNDLPAVQTVG